MNKVPMSEYYIQAMNLVSNLIDGETDQKKESRHKEFMEEGFSGTRHRIRGPFETYIASTKDSNINKQLEDSLEQIAAEAIMLLGEYLKQKDMSLHVVTFKDEEDAKKVLSLLKTEIVKKGFVSQYLYYSICGLNATFEMNYYVWTNMDSVRIMHIGESYFLDLPKPIEIKIGD